MKPTDAELEAYGKRCKQAAMYVASFLMSLDSNVASNALTMVYAQLLTEQDGKMAVAEIEGLGLVGDEERLTLFCDSVREYAKQIRAGRDAERKQNGEPPTQTVM